MKSVLFAAIFFLLSPLVVFAGGGTPTFVWDQASYTVQSGQTITVPLSVDTDNNPSMGADAVLRFDPSLVEITGVSFSSTYQQNFHSIDVGAGKLTLTGTMTEINRSYSGKSLWATISIRAKSTSGSMPLSFLCSPGVTNDSNIVYFPSGGDILLCSSLSQVTIQIQGDDVTPTPVPTAGATASPTPSPTPTPTPSPTSSGCVTPASPTNFRATSQATSAILLSWRKGANAAYYALQYGKEKGNYTHGVSNVGDGDLFMINYLEPNTTYYFSLKSISACGLPSAPVTASATTDREYTFTTRASQTPVPTAKPRNATTQDVEPTPTIIPSLDTLVGTDQQTQTPNDQQVNVPTSPTKESTKLSPLLLAGIGFGGALIFVIVGIVLMRRLRSLKMENRQLPVEETQGTSEVAQEEQK